MDISKLIQDPDWVKVEKLIEEYCERVLDIRTIDLKQPAEHVKAELIGRIESYNSMTQFLNDSGIMTKKTERLPNPFK
jgi:hypothetical protein